VSEGNGATRRIETSVLARVEGEGAMHVRLRGEEVLDVELRIFEPPRFFEALLRGRALEEASDITARICGICPVAYQTSACQAMEDALSLATHVAEAVNDPAAALRACEQARALRAARVQLTARAMGAFFHLDGVAAMVRNAMMAERAPDDYTMLDWLYGHRA